MEIHKGIIWISGYSASGKTTIGRKVESKLKEKGLSCIFLDGDQLRSIFANKWGYERDDRIELSKIYFHLSSHLASQGFIVVISAVSMYDEVRVWLKQNVSRSIEVFLDVPNEERRRRDRLTKGIYKDNNDLESIYDYPNNPDIVIENHGEMSPDIASKEIIEFFFSKKEKFISDRGRKSHWEEYYTQGAAPSKPSPYALYVIDKLKERSRVLEIGCGNGRDANYFSKMGHFVSALDSSTSAIQFCKETYSSQRINFSAETINSFATTSLSQFDAIYSRFCLHAMTPSEEIDFWHTSAELLADDGQIFVECRSINDSLSQKGEILSPTERIAGHYRRFIVLDELVNRVEECGLTIKEVIEGDGLAIFKNENPVVIRLTAYKKV